MSKSSEISPKDISQITTYQSGVIQASVHRIMNRVVADYLLQHGLTSMQWYIIGHIYDAGDKGLRLSDLTRKIHTTLPYVTNTIILLESRGIVQKLSHAGDNRIKLVSIAPSFRPRIDDIESGLRGRLRETIYDKSGVSRQELNDYIAVLYKIFYNANR